MFQPTKPEALRIAPTLDKLSRPLRDLRISVTDRCNFRCGYCMPREIFGPGHQFLPRTMVLSYEEIARLAGIFALLGVVKIRLTGGEPLLRRDLETLIAKLALIRGIDDLSLTTNGSLLDASKARALKAAGLGRVTVSLDALDDRTFASMSDSQLPVSRVLDAIVAAHDAGLTPVKVNMVVRRGINDSCVIPMAAHFRNTGVIVRFIEYMDVGQSNGWRLEEVVSARSIIEQLQSQWPMQPLAARYPGEVANTWRYLDGAGEIGVIASVTQPFCGNCNRARLSSDGKLFTCLFAANGLDLRALLRAGCDDGILVEAIHSGWLQREDRYSELRTRVSKPDSKIEMSYIGG
ncbi:MAG TPA: GTP 3',8-cyclase MoaA [Gammaproteobacteria bacterium]|nr:GTP 3',8-cyclase MoaA [Gammaproteobacteria bacterium]